MSDTATPRGSAQQMAQRHHVFDKMIKEQALEQAREGTDELVEKMDKKQKAEFAREARSASRAEAEKATSRGLGASQTTIAKAKEGTPKEQMHERPQLARPLSVPASKASLMSPKGISIITIMSQIMTLAAKGNMDSFLTTWKIGTSAMHEQMQMSVLVGKATVEAGEAQAEATRNQAKGELVSGIVNLATFALTCTFAALTGGGEVAEEAKQSAEEIELETQEAREAAEQAKLTKQTALSEASTEEGTAENVGTKVGQEAESKTTDEARETATQEEESEAAHTEEAAARKAEAKKTDEAKADATKEKVIDAEKKKVKEDAQTPPEKKAESIAKKIGAKIKAAYNKGSPGLKAFSEGLTKAQFFQQLSQGLTGVMKFGYDNKVAYYQGLAGQWQAVKGMGETDVQFMGQAFGRSEGVTGQLQQNINSACQILEQSASAITQSVVSGFNI
ncbi:MAG: hypothetical protein S4CHLAM45_13360 [Chlamydiales bacterium]|nr:hypothetical protein [Chlamydiales bacterium]MCH9620592.1 hypothetical protein [Chlamydiales bacterium]MCH9623426.1 hypothetical protein [Chlamydiales bacterium]